MMDTITVYYLYKCKCLQNIAKVTTCITFTLLFTI
ncbi:hypothetical protein Bcoa_1739 [Heyndrickxia coagulans 36D1]|uniref:Uncharacterized protein n=1 Tax=Heyndrickxia coagulans 36D1 TaxID=345219 RepID=G2TI01_HEYCO|nr:hypothetical protein Bcoa_1739 [Heyndrickxia coagulans 36D1]